MAFAALTIDLNARIAKFEQEMQRAGKSLDSLDRRANAAAAGLKAAFGALGATLSAGALASFAKTGIDAADALNDMSQRLGVSVKDLASFKLAAEQSGTSLDSVGTGIARLSKSIGEAEAGNKKLAGALGQLGITARDPKEAFFQLADAVQRIEDPSQRAALLSQVLGKSYGELVPLLGQGSQALRDSAAASATFAEQMAKLAPDADRFNDELERLQTEAAGAAGKLLNRLVPGLADTAKEVGKLLDEDHGILALGRALAGIGKIPFDIAIGDPFKPAETAKERIKELRIELGQLERNKASAGGKLLQSIFGTPEEIDQKILVIKNQITALEKFGEQIYRPKPAATPANSDDPLNLDRILADSGKKIDKLALWAEEMRGARKAAAEESERLADDIAFMADVKLTQENPIAAWAQEWKDAIGGIDFGDILGSILPSANGNAFSGGKVIPFARGGVVSSPTMFPLGLMGEAGPEAILPLKRGADGKLGVAGGGSAVQVVINNTTGMQASTRETDQGGVRTIEVFFEQYDAWNARNVSSGRGATTQAMERRYGLNASAGSYR